MELGIVKGFEIKKNKDSTVKSLLLQVDMIEDENDVRTVELMLQAGEDTNPAKSSRVLVVDTAEGYQVGISVNDGLEPETDPGEKEFYSTDSPATTKKATLKLDKNSNLQLNGDDDNAVRFEKMKEVIDEITADITALKAVLGAGWVVVPFDGGGALKAAAATWAALPLTTDINDAKVDTVKLP